MGIPPRTSQIQERALRATRAPGEHRGVTATLFRRWCPACGEDTVHQRVVQGTSDGEPVEERTSCSECGRDGDPGASMR